MPGRGNIDLIAVLRALKDVDFDGPINLECAGALEYDLWQAASVAAESRGYLHRCMRELNIDWR